MARTKLRVWIMSDGGYWHATSLYSQFYETYLKKKMGMEIEWHLVPWNSVWQELIESFKNNRSPDVFQLGTTWLSSMAHMGFLAPVPSGLIGQKAVVKWMEEIVRYNSRHMAVPWFIDISILMARQDILHSYQIDTTKPLKWEEFYNLCSEIGESALISRQKKKENPDNPLPLGISFHPEITTLHNIIPWLWAGGWNFPDFKNPPFRIFNDEKANVSFDYLSGLYAACKMPGNILLAPSHTLQHDFFHKGEFVFFISHWCLDIIKKYGIFPDQFEYNWPFTAIPFPAGPYGSIPWGGGSVLCVSSQSKHKEESWNLIGHMAKDDFMKRKTQLSGSFPALEGLFWEEIRGIKSLAPYYDMIKNSSTYPSHPLWCSIEILLSSSLSELFTLFAGDGRNMDKASEIIIKADDKINELFSLAWGL